MADTLQQIRFHEIREAPWLTPFLRELERLLRRTQEDVDTLVGRRGSPTFQADVSLNSHRARNALDPLLVGDYVTLRYLQANALVKNSAGVYVATANVDMEGFRIEDLGKDRSTQDAISRGGVETLPDTIPFGTAAAPGLAFRDDVGLNTGIFGAEDTFGISTGGVEAVRWDASQHMVVPTTKRLTVGANMLYGSITDKLNAAHLAITAQAVGDVLYADSTTSFARLADVAVGSYLRSGGVGVAPLWATLTLPNAATTGDLLAASGANAVGVMAAVADGNVLRSAGVGVLPVYGKVRLSGGTTDITGVLAEANGGTDQSTYAQGDLLHASTADTLARLAILGAGRFLRSTGTLPEWSTLTVPNAATTGDLLAASGANAVGVMAAVASGSILISQGAGVLPVWSTTPTASEYRVSGTKVVGAQGAAVADAAGGATIDVEARTAINLLLARERTHGLIAT